MKTFKTAKGTILPLLDMKGKDYLQIAQRLVWFREELPKWRIETEFFQLTEKYAIARATIRNESGEIMATAHKREDAGHFGDFIEKAETGAIGRALAYVGYGTQFCADEVESSTLTLDEGSRIADAPVTATKKIKSVTLAEPARPMKAQVEEARSPAPSAWDSFNSYRVPFGKTTKGKTLEEIGVEELANCVINLQNDFGNKNKPIVGQYAEFIAKAEEFVREKKSRPAS